MYNYTCIFVAATTCMFRFERMNEKVLELCKKEERTLEIQRRRGRSVPIKWPGRVTLQEETDRLVVSQHQESGQRTCTNTPGEIISSCRFVLIRINRM